MTEKFLLVLCAVYFILFVSTIITAIIMYRESKEPKEINLIVEFKDPEESKDQVQSKPVEVTSIIDVEPSIAPPKDNDYEEEAPTYTIYDVPLDEDIQRYIQDQCREKFGTLELCGYNLPKLITNIIRWESGFDADNDNGKCCGLMSVTHKLSDTIREEEHITNLIDPKQNIRAGIRILKNQYDYVDELLNDHDFPYDGGIASKAIRIRMMLDCYHNGRDDSRTEMDDEYIRNIMSTYFETEERS